MDYSLGFNRNINFPILTVTGTKGDDGADGSDGTVVLFDNTPSSATETVTTSWETFSGMTSGSIASLRAAGGDKLFVLGIVTVDDDDSDVSSKERNLRVYLNNAIALGDGVGFNYTVPSGVTRIKMEFEITVKSATSLFIDAKIYSASGNTGDTYVSTFSETVAVADVTSLDDIELQGDSFTAGDMQCETFSIKLMKKS